MAFFTILSLVTISLATEVPAPILQLGDGNYYSKYAFLVDKDARNLSLWEQAETGFLKNKMYSADMGKSDGDKQIVGDHKTPEGVYFLLEMLKGVKIPFELYGSRAYTTNYPNYFDRREGKTGSGIWLHAVPDSTPLTRGSRGCVVIRDKAILEVEPYFKPRTTPIIIEKEVTMISRQELVRRRERIKDFLASWLRDWREQNIAAYMSHYHEGFRAKGMNNSQWRQYKTRIRQPHVTVEISQPIILASENEVTIRFLQSFRSNNLSDFGEKTLYLYDNGSELKIFGEDWQETSDHLARAEWANRKFQRSLEASTHNPAQDSGTAGSL